MKYLIVCDFRKRFAKFASMIHIRLQITHEAFLKYKFQHYYKNRTKTRRFFFYELFFIVQIFIISAAKLRF